jgi:hypothetical protein
MPKNNTNPPNEETPQETSKHVAETFFGVTDDKASRQKVIWQLLAGAPACAVVIPALFYLKFGEIGGLGWGTTVFFVVYCLLAAIGLYFQPLTAYHTLVRLRGDWVDRVGAFWLVSCVFGPFLGWVITSVFPLTVASWHMLYGLRVFLAVGLPLITALPLTRYLRGKAIWVALPLLVAVTMLPIMSAVNPSRDLWNGPVVRQVQPTGKYELYLQYTKQTLGVKK